MNLLFISLGCDKNLVDSEEMLGILNSRGYSFTDDEEEADAVIVNTCCFINDAKEESINTICEMARLKKNGRCKALIVTGCLAQRYKDEITNEIPEVDALVGTDAYNEIGAALDAAMNGDRTMRFEADSRHPVTKSGRVLTTGGHFAYLKIAEGCDKYCTYCIIPSIRGAYRSRPMEELVDEARTLAEKGVKELILVAQETTLYGTDIYGKKMLHELLKKLCEIQDLVWIRLLYCYPEEITGELIQTIKTEEKICKYIDMPIQHASDNVLKRMGRRTNKQQLIDIIASIRKEIPEIVLRTTLISGFPGETSEDHEELLEFVDRMEFDRLGVFAYSQEEDTPAATMPDQVDDEVKLQRRDEIMQLQQEIVFENAEAMKGKKLLVMIEGKLTDEDVYVGRSYMDSPNVDGNVFVNTNWELMTGDFVTVDITGASGYDLIGEIM
ncbi:30S ribosomal protein S12 methylthiotransferase RimO [Parasporobacterium paucivorans]|uniref:Ribosomal protein uS12 methylthiotransferase RimO n=1 Tax=Parasporobacterium paucivorans DSM 15970 TaxID=1122934 RepID=A0A1M6F9D7_9FIRM|nr:30S ribosomal protein S12 methylthiotransferase RimO [Parasporobacterium paucivorans]SHI94348.1 SSU ribosomal protein S12P methylthiotransferase [Parasporobacterium paucivorans DSM 15970]